MTIVAIKNGIEDWERHKQDKEMNERRTLRIVGAGPDEAWVNYNVRGGISIGPKQLNPVLWIEWALSMIFKGIARLFRLLVKITGKAPATDDAREQVLDEAAVGRLRPRNFNSGGPSPSQTRELSPDGRSEAIGVPPPSPQSAHLPLPTETVLDDIEAASAGEIEIDDDLEVDAQDREELCRILNGWAEVKWQDVVVGDLLLLRDGDPVPADSIIVSSSEQDGMAFVETRSLDGETNLKVRRGPLMSLNHLMRDAEACRGMRLKVDAEKPSDNLHSFQGVIEELNTAVDDAGVPTVASTVAPLTLNNLLLRGSVVRNTQWCIVLVIYTGADSKIIRNAGVTPSKRSLVERQMNPQVLLNVIILIGMSLICAIMHLLYTKSFNLTHVPWTGLDDPAPTTVFIFWNCMIMFQNIIPLALYISADIGKTLQALFIYFDDFMAHPEETPARAKKTLGSSGSGNQQPPLRLSRVSPRTWNLSDDLGQIEYIFSDKTGTLTQNVMEFRKCSVNGIIYGGGYLAEKPVAGKPEELDVHYLGDKANESEWERNKRLARRAMRRVLPQNARRYVSRDPTFADERMWHDFAGDSGREQMKRLQMFWTHLAVCHTVLVELRKEKLDADGSRTRRTINYKAQSPDEAALVATARDSGFIFLGRKDTEITVLVLGKERVFTVLNVLEFTSERKRMSVVVKADDGKIFLFCKGADSVVFDRLAPVFGNSVSALRQRSMEDLTVSQLDGFASEGLRTLCVAYRVVPPAEYSEWNARYVAASTLLRDRDEEMARVAEEIEVDLQLLGCTGIDDNLQEGVPLAIEKLRSAGIKIWVLTGDKLETAINIGFASNLLHQNSTMLIIKSCHNAATARRNLVTALKSFWFASGLPSDHSSERALIIDGDSLQYALEPENRQLFLELACRCRAVMCCRASPLQKADVTKLVRQGLGAACLAIGDGANDVNMIQQANVGVGIAGKEGLQASMSSDYTIAQFRFLARLLLVHGRWCYMRIADMIFVYFYKNVLWIFVLFWYQFFCGFSASDITDFVYGMFFSTLFTFLPTFAVGIFEQDVNDRTAMAVPQLYNTGIRQALFTHEHYWLYVGDAIYQSAVYFFGCVLLFEDATPDSMGFSSDKAQLGNMLAWMLVINGNLYTLFVAKRWTSIIIWSLAITMLIFFTFCFVYWSLPSSPAYGVIPHMIVMPAFWIQWLLCSVVAFLPRFVSDYVRQEFVPSDSGLMREVEKFRIRDCLALNGADVWSHQDLDDLYGSWAEGTSEMLRGALVKSALESGEKDEPPSFADDPMFAHAGTGSESFDSLLRLRRAAKTLTRSFSGSLSALMDKVPGIRRNQAVAADGPRHANIVYMDDPEHAVPYGGFAFSMDPGTADIALPKHLDHDNRSHVSSSEGGAHEPPLVRWLDVASTSDHHGNNDAVDNGETEAEDALSEAAAASAVDGQAN